MTLPCCQNWWLKRSGSWFRFVFFTPLLKTKMTNWKKLPFLGDASTHSWLVFPGSHVSFQGCNLMTSSSWKGDSFGVISWSYPPPCGCWLVTTRMTWHPFFLFGNPKLNLHWWMYGAWWLLQVIVIHPWRFNESNLKINDALLQMTTLPLFQRGPENSQVNQPLGP